MIPARQTKPHSVTAIILLTFSSPLLALDYQVTVLDTTGHNRAIVSDTDGTALAGYAWANGSSGIPHAVTWGSATGSLIDLHPTGFVNSSAYASSAGTQAGNVTNAAGSNSHAALWYGTAASFVDLHPAGFSTSVALDTIGLKQAGYGVVPANSREHALLWSGTAASVVDLHPAIVSSSRVTAMSDTSLAGVGNFQTTFHALYWPDFTPNAVDLHPAGFTNSQAAGISGTSQVGYGLAMSGGTHALLWNGTAASVIDLNPQDFSTSFANDVYGTTQVGYGNNSGTRALAWHGSAASAVDLQAYVEELDLGISQSFATGIAPDGSISGYGTRNGTTYYPLVWKPIVEGDYNGNGSVDAADYVLWRHGGPLANEVADPGTVSDDDYTAWRERFGNTWLSSAPLFANVIPEPTSIVLLLIGLGLRPYVHRRRTPEFVPRA